MGTYATVDEIRAASPNISVVADGTDEDITRWAAEAYVVLNNFCRQKFDFEQQKTKKARYTYYPQVYLPSVISGTVTVYANLPGEDPELLDNDEEIDVDPGTYWLHYSARNVMNSQYSPKTVTLAITADWGFAASVEALLVLAANDLQAKYNAHIASATFHLVSDADNPVVGTATDLATVLVQLNLLKAAYNAHVADTGFHLVADTNLVTAANATDEDTAVTLVEELKLRYNRHVASTSLHSAEDSTLFKLSVDNPIFPEEIKIAFYRVVQRIAIRDNEEDNRYHNSGYTSESFSDGYSYSLANPAYRTLIPPNDEELLADYVNEGQIAY